MNVFIHSRFGALYQQHPLVLVDVGARGGLRKQWLPAKRHLRVIGFEPDQREYRQLVQQAQASNEAVLYFDKALHHRRGPIRLQITRDAGLTSLFEPNRTFIDAFPDADRFDIVDVQDVDACPLDELLESHHIADVDFLKVDTQGSELYVIRGASRVLAAAGVGVEVEVEFASLYRGQPLFGEVDAALRDLGYSLFDLRPCHWKRTVGRALGGPRGQLVWADALYLKSIEALKANLESFDAEMRKAKALRAISVSLLYGYWDYALEIARETAACFDSDERTAIVESLRNSGAAVRHRLRFPGRDLMAALFHRLWKLTVLPNDAWSVGGAKLGN